MFGIVDGTNNHYWYEIMLRNLGFEFQKNSALKSFVAKIGLIKSQTFIFAKNFEIH